MVALPRYQSPSVSECECCVGVFKYSSLLYWIVLGERETSCLAVARLEYLYVRGLPFPVELRSWWLCGGSIFRRVRVSLCASIGFLCWWWEYISSGNVSSRDSNSMMTLEFRNQSVLIDLTVWLDKKGIYYRKEGIGTVIIDMKRCCIKEE